MIRTFFVICLLLAPVSSLVAQGEHNHLQKETEELRLLVESLRQENAKLKHELSDLRSAQNERSDAHAQSSGRDLNTVLEVQEVQQLLAAEERRISEYRRFASDLRSQQKIADQTSDEQMAVLESELKHLDILQEELEAQHNTLSASAAASQVMANRLAEARIENRLNLLEANAMVQVLRERREAMAKAKDPETLVNVEKAKLLVEQRRAELEVSQNRAGGVKAPLERKEALAYIKVAELKLREAELMVHQAQEQLGEPSREVDDRLTEALIQLAVSKAMERELAKEAAELSDFAKAASSFEQIHQQKAALQQQLIELKQKALERQAQLRAKELTIKNHSELGQFRKLHEELLPQLRAKENALLEKLGEGHPTVKAIRREIELFIQHLDQLSEGSNRTK